MLPFTSKTLIDDVVGKRNVELIPRLAKVGLFPNDPAKIAEVQRQAPRVGKFLK